MEPGLRAIISKGYDSNVYVIEGEKTILVDTGLGLTPKIKRKVGEVDIIINTHAHVDHCGGNNYFNAIIYMHPKDIEEAKNGNFYGTAKLFGREISFEPEPIPNKIKNGEYLFEVLHTPGHTPGSICLYEPRKKILISGDILFPNGSFGREDLGGNTRDLLASLKMLAKLDFEWLLPGHGKPVNNGKKHAQLAYEVAESIFGI